MASNPYNRRTLIKALQVYQSTKSFRLTGIELGVGKSTARRMVRKAWDLGLNSDDVEDTAQAFMESIACEGVVSDETAGSTRVITGKNIRTLEGLLSAASVNSDEWIVSKKVVNKWDALAKGDEPGTSKTVEMFQVKAWLERRPEFFIKEVSPIQAIRRAIPKTEAPTQTALIIPDSQHGFRKGLRGELIPLHDRAACDLSIQAARLLSPDVIVLLGDMIDFAGLSSFTKEPDLRFLIQPALVELHWMIQSLRLACPSSRIVYLEGNHEYRLRRSLIERVDELADVRPVKDLYGAASLSVERLLNLKDLDVEYIGEYGEYFWLFDSVKVHHGNVAKSRGGATVSAILSNATCSHIVGHIHRREHAARTISSKPGDGVGPKKDRTTISAMSPGCLCSLDKSKVPSRKGSPVLDWQHGLGIVTSTPFGVFMNLLPIDNGICVINGRVLQGDPGVVELKKATGYEF